MVAELLDESRHDVLVHQLEVLRVLLGGDLLEAPPVVLLELLLELVGDVLLVVLGNRHNFFAVQVQRLLQCFLRLGVLVLPQQLVKRLVGSVLQLFDQLLLLWVGLRRSLELGQLLLHRLLLGGVVLGQEALELALQLGLPVEGRQHFLDEGARVDLRVWPVEWHLERRVTVVRGAYILAAERAGLGPCGGRLVGRERILSLRKSLLPHLTPQCDVGPLHAVDLLTDDLTLLGQRGHRLLRKRVTHRLVEQAKLTLELLVALLLAELELLGVHAA